MARTKSTTTETQNTQVEIPAIDIQTVRLTLVGDSPLIMHRWSEKAKRQMLDKQMKKASKGKEAKDPQADYEASIYRLEDGTGYGFPSVAFKAAAVRAAKSAGMPMTDARCAFHVLGELSPVIGAPQMREDMVRVGNGTADIRYRAEFVEWRAELTVRFNTRVISLEQVINLFNIAGFGTGVGEWRPEKSGSYGCFHVATDGE